MNHRLNRTLSTLAVAGLLMSALQACVPIVAAGIGTGVAATVDRRTYGAQVEDTNLEIKAANTIRQQLGSRVKVSVTSFNRWVLLTGQAQDEESRAEATRLAGAEVNVRQVFSEVAIANSPNLAAVSNDVYLTTLVKARLFDTPGISGNNVKVVTDSGVVYLMGLLTEQEAEAASKAAASTAGVRKVVQVLEIISEEEARRLSPPPAQSPPPVNTRDTPN